MDQQMDSRQNNKLMTDGEIHKATESAAHRDSDQIDQRQNNK
jgi:hypothetical protein